MEVPFLLSYRCLKVISCNAETRLSLARFLLSISYCSKKPFCNVASAFEPVSGVTVNVGL
jgi:hypothetical protein